MKNNEIYGNYFEGLLKKPFITKNPLKRIYSDHKPNANLT